MHLGLIGCSSSKLGSGEGSLPFLPLLFHLTSSPPALLRLSKIAFLALPNPSPDSMVGHKFIEALKEKDPSNKFNVVTFCEEKLAAYNRMRLTEVCMLCVCAS